MEENTPYQHLKNTYYNILSKYIHSNATTQSLDEGRQLGKKAVAENINSLFIVAIHFDWLMNLLILEPNNQNKISEKANEFLFATLSSYGEANNGIKEAINLLSKNSSIAANRILELQNLVDEKDALLNEVHHRIKNNLQIVSSFLNLQHNTTKNAIAQNAILESLSRVKAISLIHQIFHQKNMSYKVLMSDYINNVVNYLFQIYEMKDVKIEYIPDIEKIELNIDTASSLGLIINEIITNSILHGFVGKKSGQIKLSLKESENNLYLTIHDNGIGLDKNVNTKNPSTLGLQIISNLVKQMKGEINFENNNGTTISISLKAI